jgi:rubredoxin
MSDDYIDCVAALLPKDALNRYIEIKSGIFQRREEIQTLEKQLMEIGQKYGVPNIDTPNTTANTSIQMALGATDVEVNSIWIAAPPSWCCPCCGRAKRECARRGIMGQMLGKLVAHHDHIEDYIDVVLTERSSEQSMEGASSKDASKFIRRGMDLFARFDRVVVCEDCNNADANAKNGVAADRYFTFTPREISSFIVAKPNTVHEIDNVAVSRAYARAKPLYDRRVTSLRRLAEQALNGLSWYEPVDFLDLESEITRSACQALKMFGLHDAREWMLREMFFPKRKIDRKHAPAWRTKHVPAQRTPNESEIAFVIAGNQSYEMLPQDWVCHCCARRKRDSIRWSQNSKKFMFVVGTRNVRDDNAPHGKRSVEVCEACGHVFQQCSKELRTYLGEVAPAYPVTIDDVRGIIRPKPYSMHEVDGDAAQALIDRLVSQFKFE